MDWINDYYDDITHSELKEDLETLNNIMNKYNRNILIGKQIHLMLSNAVMDEVECDLTDEQSEAYSFHMGRFVASEFLIRYMETFKHVVQEYFQTYGDNYCIDEKEEVEE